MHDFGGAITAVLAVIFLVSAVRRQFSRLAAPPASSAAATRPAPAPAVRPQPALDPPLPPRRRVALAPTAPPPLPDAFPNLDLTLGGPLTIDVAGTAWPRRAPAGRYRLGRPGWGAEAIVAMEVLGPPVSLRGGATLGAPHAL